MKPIIAAIVFLLSTTISVFGADFYVSTAGSDGNPGTQAQPFASIQHAIDACPAQPITSTIHLDASTWNESPVYTKAITVIGDYYGPHGPGGRTASMINGMVNIGVPEGGNISGVKQITVKQIYTSGWCAGTLVDSCDVTGANGDGITFSNSLPYDLGIMVSNSTISNCSGNGVYCGGSLSFNSSEVKNCIIHDCMLNGIKNYGPGLLHDNDIYNCQGWGIYGDAQLIYGNSVHSNSLGGFYGAASTFYQNSIYNNSSYGLQFNNGSAKVYNNTIQTNQSYGVYFTGTSCNPDLGGGAQSSPGNNTISGNGTYEVYNASPNNIYAKNNHWDSQSEGEMAGGYYNTVNVTRIWDKWEDGSKGYIMWSDPNPTKAAAPSIGLIKATFYPSSNTVGQAKKR